MTMRATWWLGSLSLAVGLAGCAEVDETDDEAGSTDTELDDTTDDTDDGGDPVDCEIGLEEGDCAPDFTLVDVNPNSSSFERERSRDEFLGNVLVVYFSQAT